MAYTQDETKLNESQVSEPRIVLSRLLGFSSSEATAVDFRDATFAARVGAKVGGSEVDAPAK